MIDIVRYIWEIREKGVILKMENTDGLPGVHTRPTAHVTTETGWFLIRPEPNVNKNFICILVTDEY